MKLDLDLHNLLACFVVYHKKGNILDVEDFIKALQKDREEEEAFLDDLDTKVRMDPENKHGSW